MPARVAAKLLRMSLVVLCATAALVHGRVWSAEAGADDAGVELYEKKIRPALVEHCLKCHGPDKQEASLQLDSVAAMLRGGDQGPSIVPGDPDGSLLVQAIRYDDVNFQMPPKGKMPDDVVAAFEKWVSLGAPAPASEQRKPEAAAVKKFDLAERAKHWCFQPIRAVPPPQTRDQVWPRGAVDRFLLQKLEEAGLRPAREAEPYEIVRRLSYDLIGLPPTPSETAAFVRDYGQAKDDAAREAVYAALVDRLLASPHFGERWARHWLDLVRYAETRGHEFDHAIPNAFQYRDYVIRALNADVPYDRFVVEHLAGDLLAEPRQRPQTGANESNESILGTGFWFLGEEVHSPVDIRQDETDRVDNKIDVMSKTFLGLTLACARCHDHKFDALSTKDYYAMAGFVLGMSQRQAAFETAEHNKGIARQIAALDREHEAAVRAAQLQLWRPVLDKLDRYLLAAREVEYAVRAAKDQRDEAVSAAVTKAATEFEVDRRKLAAWRDYLATAEAMDEALGLWVMFAREAKLPLLKSENTLSLEVAASEAEKPPRVIVDYTRPQPGQWLEDGMTFGGGPSNVGTLCIGGSAGRPLSGIVTLRGATADLRWSGLAENVAGESGPGRVNWAQAGRTLKTPTFTLTTGKLRYLVRGSGHVYACVASHRLNNGPLHGKLIKRFDGGDDSAQFIDHDLSDYVGQRIQLEFSPLESDQVSAKHSADLTVVAVVEVDGSPNPYWHQRLFIPYDESAAEQQKRRDQLDLATLAKSQPEQQARSLAKLMRQALTEIAESLAGGELSNRRTYAPFVDWMLHHPELFSTPSPAVEGRLADYFAKREALWKQAKPIGPTAPAAWEGSAVDEYVLIRGNHRTVGELVPRRFLEAIDGETPPAYGTSGGRLALAERLVDRSDPLPARVMVNRLWQHLFGQGLVRTVDNFGAMGELPTHPELLDHLAQQFMDDGWSVKRMIRTLVTSRAYRMSSRMNSAAVAEAAPSPPAPLPRVSSNRGEGSQAVANASIVDPLNKLLHRANAKRLEGEIVRDAMLAVSGRLDRTLFGPSVETYITPFMDGRGKPQSGPLDGNGRRSIYLKVRRNFLNPMFQAFDYPTPFTSVGRRSTSNVPQQSLSLMNGELPTLLAEQWAKRLLADNTATPEQRIGLLYREAFARDPSADEIAAGLEFMAEQRKSYAAAPTATATDSEVRVWADYAHVLLNTKEFIFIP